MAALVPRDYQEAAVTQTFTYLTEYRESNPLIVMPTGSGKAIVIAMIIHRMLTWWPGQRILVLTHSKELIDQNYKKLLQLWSTAPAGIYSSGLDRRDTHQPVIFAGIQSVAKRSQLLGHFDLILIDEAHIVGDGDTTNYLKFLTGAKSINPNVRIVGLTATDYRVGMGRLTQGKIFSGVSFDLSSLEGFNWLLSEGYLKPLIPQPTNTEFDISEVHTQKGEYNLSELQDAMDKVDLNRLACKEMIEKGHNRKHWLVFASGVEHAVHVADMLESMGVSAIAIHSKMGDEARDAAIAEFKAGKYRVAVNNNILTTGFDFPEIDLIGVLRPTKSTGLWVQMLGRGTRPVYADLYDLLTREGRLAAIYYGGAPNCLVLDFAKNTPRLGPINDPVIPKEKNASGGGGTAPVKQCPACSTWVHASVTVCPFCAADIPRQIKLDVKSGIQDLIKLKIDPPPPPAPPVIESYPVSKVTYQRHSKTGRPDSIKVTYYVGNKGYTRFEEWVCPEHDNQRGRATHWWRYRTDLPLPATTEDALELVNELKVPDSIRVRIDQKFKEIVGYGNIVTPAHA